MSKYLIKTTEVYRADSEEEAKELVNTAKKDYRYTVTKSIMENVRKKVDGEYDEWKRVTITKVFSDEKIPEGNLMPIYSDQKEEE